MPPHNERPSSNIDELSGVEGSMPKFARRRSPPSTHQVVTDEVDAEMYDKADADVSSIKCLTSWMRERRANVKKNRGRD